VRATDAAIDDQFGRGSGGSSAVKAVEKRSTKAVEVVAMRESDGEPNQ